MAQKHPTSPRLIFSVVITALLSGIALSTVYSLTLPMIRRNQANVIRQAIFRVLPGTVSFRTYLVKDIGVVPFRGEDGALPEGDTLYMGLNEAGHVTGYAVPAQGPGFMDTIKIIFGYRPDEALIVGMAVLESRETPGLGDKIEKDAAFLASFEALAVRPEIVAVTRGPRVEQNQVDAISGATISSQAVVHILNQGIRDLPKRLPTAPEEP